MNQQEYSLFTNDKVNFQAILHEDSRALELIVESNGYKGHGPIYLDNVSLQNANLTLSEMIKNLRGEIILKDSESNLYYLKIYFEKQHLIVNGMIGDYCRHSLQFEFNADQTVLGLLQVVIKKMLKLFS